jgi:putative monooxygenase
MSISAPAVVSVESVPSNRKRGGDLRVLLSPKTIDATAGFGGVIYLKPGEFVTEHYHPYSDEFLIVTAGRMLLRVNGVPVELSAGEATMITRGSRHRLEHLDGELATAAFFSAPLAPRPEIGHVDTEAYPEPTETGAAR